MATPMTATQPRVRPRGTTWLLWTLQIMAAALFLFSGTLKVTGAVAMVQMFSDLGIGQWFRYATGTIEIVSAILLLVPSLALIGAAILAVTMAVAVLTHLFVIGGSPLPAAILFLITSSIVWMRRADLRG
jgi:putative oxidoreductase